MKDLFPAQIPPGMLMRIIQSKQDIIVYYEDLNATPPDQEAGIIIRDILHDERTHLHLFTGLYTDLFRELPELSTGIPALAETFTCGVRYAVMHEANSYGLYCNIFLTDGNEDVRRVFLQALMDENIHATKFNYIYMRLLEAGTNQGGG